MDKDIDDFLNGTATDEAEVAETPAEVTEEPTDDRPRDEHGRFVPKGDTEPEAEQPAEQQSAPPAPEDDASPTVPRAALQDERRKRQTLEDQLAEMGQRLAQIEQGKSQEPPAPAPSIWDDEQGWQQHFGQSVISEADRLSRVNASEIAARMKFDDFDDMFQRFNQMARDNPAIVQQALSDPMPWVKAYHIAKNVATMEAVGATDIESLKAQIRAEVEAEALAKLKADLPAREAPPTLAGERNVGSRSGPAWSGPKSIDEILSG